MQRNSFAVYKEIETVLDSLRTCTTRGELDGIFESAGISSPKEKVEMLQRCMGIEKSFGTPENISDEDDYDFECAVFEEGTWRMLS